MSGIIHVCRRYDNIAAAVDFERAVRKINTDYSLVKKEMADFYDRFWFTNEDEAFASVPGLKKICEAIYKDFDASYSSDTPAVTVKARLHRAVAEHFEPVIFPHSPFFYEMGLRRANNWGTPDKSVPNGRLLHKRFDRLRGREWDNIDGEEINGKSMNPFDSIGLFAGPETKGFDIDHHCPGYSRLFEKGVNGLLGEIREAKKSAGEAGLVFLRAAEESCEAVLLIADKFALKAAEMLRGAADEESAKYLRMIENCAKRIPKNPPESFYEGLCMLWFVREVTATLEGVGVSVVGHVDRLLYPFYKKETEAGSLCRAEAKHLLTVWMLPTDIKFKIGNSYNYAETSSCMTLGGCDKNGETVFNDVTLLILESQDEHGILNPKPNCRFGAGSPREYTETISAMMLRGKNNFALFNDDALIPALVSAGRDVADARLYVAGGCQELMCEGAEHSAGVYCTLNTARVLDLCLRPSGSAFIGCGPDNIEELPKIIEADTFEIFYGKFIAEFKRVLENSMSRRRELGKRWHEIHPCPFFSATIEGCVKNGRDYTQGGARYNDSTLCLSGFATTVDSLSAIKKAVYDDKLLSLEQLNSVLANDWADDEQLRQTLIKYPKYGRGETEADEIGNRFIGDFSRIARSIENERGGRFNASVFVYATYSLFAPFTRATPDGRKSGDLLSQSISPSRLRPTTSITDSIRSAGAARFTQSSGISVLDAQMPLGRFAPENVADIIYGFAAHGGTCIQFNFVSADELRDAKLHPEKYPGLTVRLYGMSAYFVYLPPYAQDEVINRNMYGN